MVKNIKILSCTALFVSLILYLYASSNDSLQPTIDAEPKVALEDAGSKKPKPIEVKQPRLQVEVRELPSDGERITETEDQNFSKILYDPEISSKSSDEVSEGIIDQFPNLRPEVEAYREIYERNQRLLSEYKDLIKSRNNMIRQREVIPDHITDELEDRKMALLDHAKAMGLEARDLRQKIFIEMRNR